MESENSCKVNSKIFANEVVPKKAVRYQKLRKELRNLGESYNSTTGKVIPARVVRPLESCRKRCADRITFEEQQRIHKQYWSQGSYNLRKAYVAGLIEIQETNTIKRVKHDTSPRSRTHSYYYFLEINENRIPVCQKCFRFTLSETEQFIKTVASAKLKGCSANEDLRGKHICSRKFSTAKENQILDFIKSFLSCDISKRIRRYLPSDLSVAEMYRLYGEKYNHSVSLSKFAQLFKTLNLKFKKRKLAARHKCDFYMKVAPEEILDLPEHEEINE